MRILDWLSWIVPADERDGWRREWLAEFEFARTTRRASPQWTASRLWAACQHALYLRGRRLRPDLLWQDVRHGARALARRPGFATAAILTLALGIGGTTVIFSTLRAVLWRPLPFADPDRLVMLALGENGAVVTDGSNSASPADFVDWKRFSTALTAMSAVRDDGYAVTGDGPAEQVSGDAVTEDFFNLLGVAPAKGRVIAAADIATGAPNVAVLSDTLWRRRYGQDPGILGRHVTLDAVSYEVVGIMPAGFEFPIGAEVWTPLRFTANDLTTQRGAHYLTALGRLRSGVSLDAAKAELAGIGAQLAKDYPRSNARTALSAAPLRQAIVGDAQPALRLLFAAVSLVFLVACVNVASLVIGSGMARRRDLAIRAALGASRARLIRGLFVESAILAVVGGAIGVAIASAGVRAIAATPIADIALLDGTRIDVAVLIFAGAVTAAAAVLFGAWPAWQAARREGAPHLAGAGSRTAGKDASRARDVLVVAEIAMAVALLVGAGLLGRSFLGLTRVPLGLEPDHVETAIVSLPDASYTAVDRRTAFMDDLLARLSARGDVASAAATFGVPLTNFSYYINLFSRDGQPESTDGKQLSVQIHAVTPKFFATIGTPMREGRDFGPADRRGGQSVVIVNERAAQLLWPHTDAMGHRVVVATRLGLGGDRVGGEVVGIVGDIHDVGPAAPPRATVYIAEAQWPMNPIGLVVKPRGEPADLTATIRETVAAVDPNVPVFSARSMQAVADRVLAGPRFYLLLVGLFAAVAIALAAVGIYGVMAQSVGARSREIGIRLALGATAGMAVRLVLRQAGWLALAGVGLGLGVALASTRLLASLLFGVAAADGLTFAAVTVVTLAVAALAAWVPARRAADVDPIATLRGSD